MILRFLLTALLVSGGAVPLSAHTGPDAASMARVDPAARVEVADPAPHEAADDEFREVPVVVPSVSAAGTVVEQRSARPDALVADQVVAGRVATPVLDVDDYQTIGVTWGGGEQGEDPDVEVRSRMDGNWSAWVPLEPDDAAPDAGTADSYAEQRSGTEPLWFGDADSVQLSFAARSESRPSTSSRCCSTIPRGSPPG